MLRFAADTSAYNQSLELLKTGTALPFLYGDLLSQRGEWAGAYVYLIVIDKLCDIPTVARLPTNSGVEG